MSGKSVNSVRYSASNQQLICCITIQLDWRLMLSVQHYFLLEPYVSVAVS